MGSPFRYCGAAGYQSSPDTGLMLAGNRWYDPSIGRFLSPDPSGSGDNHYAYCGNNPVSSLDPLGLQATDTSGGGISDTLGYGIAAVGAIAYGAGDSLKKIGSYLGHQLFGTGGTGDFQVSQFAQNAVSALHYHFGNTSSTFDHYLSAPTYGLPYLSILQGDPYGGFLTYAVPISGQVALGLATDGFSLAVYSGTTPFSFAEVMEGATLQTTHSNLSSDLVSQYVNLLFQGSEAPAISVDEGIIVEGNHRYVADFIARWLGYDGPPLGTVPGVSPRNPHPVVPWDQVKFY